MDRPTRDLLLARRLVAAGTARAIRETAGLSRREAARAIGVTLGAVRLWEAGARRPTGAPGVAYGAFLRALLLGVDGAEHPVEVAER